MGTMTDILNQSEAANYITRRYKKMSPTQLSKLTQVGAGPKFTKKGNQKLFMKDDIDDWIDQQQSQGGGDM